MKRLVNLMVLLSATLLPAIAQSVKWVPYSSSKEYQFTVSFCAPPSANPPTVERKGATTGTVRLFTARAEDYFCMVGISDYNYKPDVEAELLANQTNFVKAVEGTLVTSRRTEFANPPDRLPALTFTFDMPPNHTGKSIVILTGSRVYQLVFTYRKTTDYSAAMQKFLSSFAITK